VESREVKLATLALLWHPLAILVGTAVAAYLWSSTADPGTTKSICPVSLAWLKNPRAARASGVDCNAAFHCGTNFGPSNPDHMAVVGERLAAIEKHPVTDRHLTLKRSRIVRETVRAGRVRPL